ncbi:MAG: hypothetical protein IIB60_05365, partial [Planctomycetes bacterium]|nr:hypothetical protein [Planctomycetota bacterium]
MVDAGLSVGKLLVTGDTRGGEAIVERFAADDYMVKVDVDLNSGIDANVFFRRIDTNNAYVFSLYDLVGPTQGLKLSKLVNGKYTLLDSGVLFGSTLTAEIKVSGTSI